MVEFKEDTPIFIAFDGVNGVVKFFENDDEKASIDLGNEFIGKDMFFNV